MANPPRRPPVAPHGDAETPSPKITAPSRRACWIVFATLAAFAAILLLPYFYGHWRLADDSYEYSLPSWRFLERTLLLGQWPHWNLGEGFGKPTAVNSGSMFYYPFVPIWGVLIGWTEWSYLAFIYLHLVVGGWLAYRFSRRIGHTLESSLFFALAFAGNGYVLGFYSNPALLIPYLIWPLLAEGLWDLYLVSPDRPAPSPLPRPTQAVPKIALALTLIESGGYPLIKLLIYASTAIAALPLVKRHWRALSAACAIAVLCTAPEWASSIRALPLSERMGTDIYGDISYGSPTNFLAFASLLIPTAFLKRDGFQLGMVWLERSWWVGALTLAMAAAAFRRGVLQLGRYARFGFIALGGLLFALGGHSFFRELSSVVVPLLEHLRFANMGRVIPMVFLAFVGAAGFQALQIQSDDGATQLVQARKRVTGLWIGFLIACTMAALVQADSGAYSNGLYLDPATQWTMGALHTAFYLLLAYTVYALRSRVRLAIGWAGLLVVIQFVSLADVGYAFRHLVAKEIRPEQRAPEAEFRVASPQPNERSLKQWTDGDDWIKWDGNRKVFNAYTVPYHRWMRAAAQDSRTGRFAATLASCQDSPAESGLRAAIPAAHACAGTQFEIDRYYGNTVQVSGASAQPAWLMVHDFVDPGWSAELNGAPAVIQPAFGVFKAVEVPAGAWRLRFEYRHPWFPALWVISFLGFALLAATGFVPKLRERLR